MMKEELESDMLSLKNLPLKNLEGYAGRTIALMLFSMLMAVAVFGGTMLIQGVRQGLETVESRLGADIMVTPEDADTQFDAQSVLLQAEPGYFYMDKSKADEVAQVDGVERVSSQMFMASAKAGCCSARLQMIAFDPETDFTIQPWIEETFGSDDLGLMDIVVGSNVTVSGDYTITFYDEECHIAGQFSPTGSTLDNCVYMNFDTVKVLMEASFVKKLNIYGEYDPDEVISAVMVKAEPGADIEETAALIESRVEGVRAVTSKKMVSGISDSLSRLSRSITIFIVVFWIIGLLMTMLLFTMMIHARRREFASLSAMGASRGMIAGIVTREAVWINLIGGLAGIFLFGIIIILFKGLIGQSLCNGFVLPSRWVILLLAATSLASVMLAAVLSARAAVRSLGKMDPAQVLKDGE